MLVVLAFGARALPLEVMHSVSNKIEPVLNRPNLFLIKPPARRIRAPLRICNLHGARQSCLRASRTLVWTCADASILSPHHFCRESAKITHSVVCSPTPPYGKFPARLLAPFKRAYTMAAPHFAAVSMSAISKTELRYGIRSGHRLQALCRRRFPPEHSGRTAGCAPATPVARSGPCSTTAR